MGISNSPLFFTVFDMVQRNMLHEHASLIFLKKLIWSFYIANQRIYSAYFITPPVYEKWKRPLKYSILLILSAWIFTFFFLDCSKVVRKQRSTLIFMISALRSQEDRNKLVMKRRCCVFTDNNRLKLEKTYRMLKIVKRMLPELVLFITHFVYYLSLNDILHIARWNW